MKRSILRLIASAFLFTLFLASSSVPAKADECNHDWHEYDVSYSEIDVNQHKVTRSYECYNCWDTKTETENINHVWEEIEWRKEYSNNNANQHTITHHYCCNDCGAEKTTSENKPHNWREYSWKNYDRLNDTQHVIKSHYYCDDCRAEKTVSQNENHKLKLSYSNNYKSISSGQHSYKGTYYCDICGAGIEKTLKENHKFDKYGICTECDYIKPRTITLGSNKATYVNSNTWIKLNIKKKGYICLTGSDENGSSFEYKLYDKTKKLFANEQGYASGGSPDYIAVKKGTYYLKINDRRANVKYVFSKDPSKKNYTKKTAVKLKRNKAVKGVIYSSAKKKTWKRYYVLSLKKKQFIRFKSIYNGWFGWFQVYDSKGNYVSITSDINSKGENVGYITDYKMPKGKYYIEINESWTPATKKRTMGFYYSLKWK